MSAASGSCYITAAEVICTDERNLIVCNGDATASLGYTMGCSAWTGALQSSRMHAEYLKSVKKLFV